MRWIAKALRILRGKSKVSNLSTKPESRNLLDSVISAGSV